MKEKSVVLVEFTGRELTTGKVFDTTSEKAAKEAGIHRENMAFRPMPVIVGNGDVLPALDEALRGMNEGESKNIRLAPEKAFGERRKDLIVVVPIREFTERKIRPLPGLIVDVNGQYGRVQTVSGGRVRIDLNSDLAGKEVEYELKIVKELKGTQEICQELAEKFFPLKSSKAEVRAGKDGIKLKLPKELVQQLTPITVEYTKTLRSVLPDMSEVTVVESFEEKKAGTKALLPQAEKTAKKKTAPII
ncbi:MAG: peptidylprolyl isomerase [Candidatus Diapherotrites archaeon]|uniref:Peptidyl-prolyl cis-trans isomerase n=1 Tax=Candidatus Iainarchaeum sp. TaxID=3101447 RepID=A0A8T3YRL5_9ARCH|nr:peptidylprolyl isomerase [Candidatus Diapherotrites archaeon]